MSTIQSPVFPSINIEKPGLPSLPGETSAASKGEFSKHLQEFIGDVNSLQQKADKLTTDYAAGRQNDLHGTMIASEQASISFRLLANVRNRVLEAYREMMRMGA